MSPATQVEPEPEIHCVLTVMQNDYSWCNTDIKTSGWDIKVKNFTGYGIPIL